MSEDVTYGGSVLETLRTTRGDSKSLLSRKAGLSRAAIRMYENGERYLTPNASGAIGPALEFDPWALYLGHNVEVIKQRIEAGEEKSSRALALARKLVEVLESGELSEEQASSARAAVEDLVEGALGTRPEA
jgi:transcriptional regulator with XRE-family HTH domain